MSEVESRQVIEEPSQEESHTRNDEEALKELVARILKQAKQQGASAAEVSASDDVGLSVAVREGDLETVAFNRNRGIGISVYIDKQTGRTSTTDVSEESIRESVQAAINIARHTQPDPYSGLADPDRLAREFPDLDVYHPRPMDVEEATEQALIAESTAMAWDKRIFKSDGARISSDSACGAYGNSLGFLASSRRSRYSIFANVIAKTDSGMQQDYWYSTALNKEGLESPSSVGETAARRTVMKLDPRPVPTGEYPVLFDCTVAAGLISHMISALSGHAQYMKASYLLDSLNKPAATRNLTLREYPLLPRGLGSRSFDSEGVASEEKSFLEAGEVQNYVLSSYSGRQLGMPTTGNASGVCNLTLEAKQQPIEEVLKQMGSGLVVKSLMGQGVDIVTGDYSRGAAGYWVENGEFAYAVDELTIAGKLRDMFQNMVAFGDDVDLRHNIRTGSILVESMAVGAS